MVDIEIVENRLIFGCLNTVDANKIDTVDLEAGKSGIGLQNVKKRLDLIYPDQYQLDIEKKEDRYKVILILNF